MQGDGEGLLGTLGQLVEESLLEKMAFYLRTEGVHRGNSAKGDPRAWDQKVQRALGGNAVK